MKLYVHPPQGLFYGFPKEIPESCSHNDDDTIKWIIDNGYPQKLYNGYVKQDFLNKCKIYQK